MRLIGLAVVLTLSVILVPLVVEAQQAAKIAQLGYLGTDRAASPHLREAFRQGLRDLGYVEGRNLVIELRYAEEKVERLPALAAELVALKVDVIVASSTPAALAAKQATKTLPLCSLLLAIRLRASSSPALRGRAAMSRGWLCLPRS